MRIRPDEGPYPLHVLFRIGDERMYMDWATVNGLMYHGKEDENDLLLPAIEPEGAAAGMHPKVRQALVAMADLWGAFAGDIQTGLIDPCGGGCFLLDGARIACGYESREAALAECRQIIDSIDHLLEGGPAK